MRESTPASIRFWSSGRAALLGAIAVGTAAMAPASAAAQGLFDFLFGGPPQQHERPTVSYAPSYVPGGAGSYAPDHGIKVSRGSERPRHKRVKRLSVVEPAVVEKPVKTEPPAVGNGPLGTFVNDPTLRAGDVVVTAQGLMVYRGSGGSHHSPREFIGLAQASNVVAGNRATLTSIDKANRMGGVRKEPDQVAEANL
jgi:hypothetical protein